jgi:serine/arginine repetitive matrix protein 2
MAYNGVGLLTPRGSGTSGYVQGNKFNLHRAPNQNTGFDVKPDEGPRVRQPNKEILDHKKKREVELRVATEQAKLEDEG